MFSTQETARTVFIYQYLVLFDWTLDLRRPFHIFPRTMFSKKEILDKWVEATLDCRSRIKTLKPLEGLPGKTFSLFAKVEQGIKLQKNNSLCAFYKMRI